MSSTPHIGVFALLIVWLSLSVALVMLNKQVIALTPCGFPLSLALLHMSSGLVCARACLRLWPTASHQASAAAFEAHSFKHRLQVWSVGALLAGVLLTSNVSFARLAVSMIQMLKASTPAVILACGVLMGAEAYDLVKGLNVAVICLGVAIAAYGDAAFDGIGVAIQMLSIVMDSLRCLLLQKTIKGLGVTLDPLTTLANIAPAAIVVLLLPSAVFEWPVLVKSTCLSSSWHLLVISCVIAFFLNLVVCALIGATSALTTSVSGILKDFVSDQRDLCVIAARGAAGSEVSTRVVVGTIDSKSNKLTFWPLLSPTRATSQACILLAMVVHQVQIRPLQWLGYAIATAGLVIYHARRVSAK